MRWCWRGSYRVRTKLTSRGWYATASNTQSIIQCNLDLGRQVKSLETTVQDKSATIESQRAELQDAHEKLQILKRALETRFEELQLNGSLHTGVLFELTRLQDQSVSLATQLSDERKNAKALQVRDIRVLDPRERSF